MRFACGTRIGSPATVWSPRTGSATMSAGFRPLDDPAVAAPQPAALGAPEAPGAPADRAAVPDWWPTSPAPTPGPLPAPFSPSAVVVRAPVAFPVPAGALPVVPAPAGGPDGPGDGWRARNQFDTGRLAAGTASPRLPWPTPACPLCAGTAMASWPSLAERVPIPRRPTP